MRSQQIIISVVAVIVVIVLYQLPKVVVDNDEDSGLPNEQESTATHSMDLPDSILARTIEIRQSIYGTSSLNKSSIFADSLARTFLIYNQLDSAVKYADHILSLDTTGLDELAGNIYYKAFGLASDKSVAEIYGSKTREIYSSVNKRPDLEARIAMTQVTGDNPMVGILRLRELAEENPNNLEAQYNLGLLSIQSGQYDRAVERFSKIIELDPNNIEGYFYLGVSYLELGNDQKAKEYFSYVAENGNDPAVIKLVEDYLNNIN